MSIEEFLSKKYHRIPSGIGSQSRYQLRSELFFLNSINDFVNNLESVVSFKGRYSRPLGQKSTQVLFNYQQVEKHVVNHLLTSVEVGYSNQRADYRNSRRQGANSLTRDRQRKLPRHPKTKIYINTHRDLVRNYETVEAEGRLRKGFLHEAHKLGCTSICGMASELYQAQSVRKNQCTRINNEICKYCDERRKMDTTFEFFNY